MGDALERVHDWRGGHHACVFCRRPYWCETMHYMAGDPVSRGMRCCPDCAMQNMGDARKLRMGGEW